MSFASRSGRWDMEDRGWGVVGSRYPISDLRSPAAKAALADGVREVGDVPSFAANPFGGTASEGRPDFSVRYERAKWG